jgi:hypothetical protein
MIFWKQIFNWIVKVWLKYASQDNLPLLGAFRPQYNSLPHTTEQLNCGTGNDFGRFGDKLR